MVEARVERRLAAILAADVAGYSRLMGVDEEGTLAALKAYRRNLIEPKIAEHRGRIVKTTGDGALVEFASAVDAVRCAIEIQRAMAERNADVAEERRIEFRIGINVGDIIIDEGDIYGDGVNIAARVETLVSPGSICISDNAYQQIKGKLALDVSDMGEQQLKNIAQPVRVHGLRLDSAPVRPVPALPDKLSIAVLPFTNLSADPNQSFFVNGITESLTTDLSRIAGSFVISSATAATFKSRPVDVKQIGRELGIRYILQGSIQKTGEKIRVNAQLIYTETCSQIWSERFDGDSHDLFTLQDQIVGRIANSVGRQMVLAAAREAGARNQHPSSNDFLIRGIVAAERPMSLENLQEQEVCFRKAITLDENNADAWARLARSLLLQRLQFGWSLPAGVADEKLNDGGMAAKKAVALDPDNARAHLAMGLFHTIRGEHAAGARENEAAISLDHNLSLAYNVLGHNLTRLGDPDKAIKIIEQAIQLDPRGPQIAAVLSNLGTAHLFLGNSDAAIEAFSKARALNPNLARVHAGLAISFAQKGDLESARIATQELQRIAPYYRIKSSQDALQSSSTQSYKRLFEQHFLPAALRAGISE
jgi:adenylate cyclase